MRSQKRSYCPLSSFLDILGDKWSLLVVRDMLFRGKRTFGEFRDSYEKVATNILADRLSLLEREGFVTKQVHPESRAKYLYELTDKAFDLLPFLLELIVWSDKYLEIHDEARALAADIRQDRAAVVERILAKRRSERQNA